MLASRFGGEKVKGTELTSLWAVLRFFTRRGCAGGGWNRSRCLTQTPVVTATAPRVSIGEQLQLQAPWFWRGCCVSLH